MRNVLVILCDQLRCDFLSLYGCDAVPTPHLDRLAKEGVVFDRAITASPVCAPARASMMTGLYPNQHGVVTNYAPFRDGLDLLPEGMNRLGYATGAFGKLHHNPGTDVKGFRHARQMEEGRLGDGDPYLAWLRERHPETKNCWNNEYRPGQLHCRLPAEEHYEHWIASEAIAWLADLPAETPFFGWVSFQGPHGPFNPPREVLGCCDASRLPQALPPQEGSMPTRQAYRQELDRFMVGEPVDAVRDNSAIRIAYAEMIAFIDMQIGRLLDHLESTGRYDQTTVIFSADHGDLLGDCGLWGKGACGLAPHLEIPLLLSHHPGLEAGSRSDALANNLDIPGTVLAIAGDTSGIGLSRSLLDLARPNPADPRAVNFSEYGNSTKFAEDREWRYAYYPLTGEGELFRIEAPNERLNPAGDPERMRKERDLLMRLLDLESVINGIEGSLGRAVPPMGDRLHDIHPGFVVARDPERYPPDHRQCLREAGLPSDYRVRRTAGSA